MVVAGVSWAIGGREHGQVSVSTRPGEEGAGQEPVMSLSHNRSPNATKTQVTEQTLQPHEQANEG